MAKTKTKPDKDLYGKLRDRGLRKKAARRISTALPSKGSPQPAAAHGIADELSDVAETIRERAGGGKRKRSEAAKKAARTRKANARKRSARGKKAAKSRAKAKA